MTRSEAARLGGRARAALAPERRRESAARGFQALVDPRSDHARPPPGRSQLGGSVLGGSKPPTGEDQAPCPRGTPCVRPPPPPPPPDRHHQRRPPRGGRRPRPLGTTRRALRRRGSPLPPRAPRRPPLHHRPHRKAEAQRRPRTGQLVLPHRAGRPLGPLQLDDHFARRPRRHTGGHRWLPRHARRGGPRQGRRFGCFQACICPVRHR